MLTNTGSASLNLSSSTIVGASGGDFTLDTQLMPGEFCLFAFQCPTVSNDALALML
jgi:hypothetical protein